MKGTGNQQDYGMRIYDPRVGRFFSVDPLTSSYPWYTPYQFAGNKVIAFNELEGLEEEYKLNVYASMKEASNPKLSQVDALRVYRQTLENLRPMSRLPLEVLGFHETMDALGFIPVLGEAADGLNAIVYTSKKDYLNASLSTISLAAVGGDLAACQRPLFPVSSKLED